MHTHTFFALFYVFKSTVFGDLGFSLFVVILRGAICSWVGRVEGGGSERN